MIHPALSSLRESATGAKPTFVASGLTAGGGDTSGNLAVMIVGAHPAPSTAISANIERAISIGLRADVRRDSIATS